MTDTPRSTSLVVRFGERYGLEPVRVLNTLKATAFKTDKPITDEQMMSLMIVAERHNLDPFTREIFAFPDKGGGIVPVVSVDGWARKINEHPMMDGIDFAWDPNEKSMTCTIHRKDRAYPISVTEYLEECKRNTAPWQSHPRRMMRHKAEIQCARVAFGFAGIYDEDEAQRIVETDSVHEEPASTGARRVRKILAHEPTAAAPVQTIEVIDAATVNDDEMTFEELGVALLRAPDADSAAVVLDEARSTKSITPQQLEELAQAWAGKWQQPNDEKE